LPDTLCQLLHAGNLAGGRQHRRHELLELPRARGGEHA
jgi:hypothetical protein